MTQRRYRDLATLVKDLRKGDGSAAAEFTRRFTPLLRRSAGRLHVDRGDRSDVIGSVLSDVMLHLIHCGSAIPENLGAYAVVALRNRLLMELRGRARAALAAEMPLEDAEEELDAACVRSFLDTGGKATRIRLPCGASLIRTALAG